MQKPYEQFTPADWVCDDDFLKHQLAPTEDSTRFWDEWLRQHPTRQTDWQEARQLLEAVRQGLSQYARTYLSEEAENRLLERIRATNANAEAPTVPLGRPWVKWAAAACVVLLAGLGGWFLLRRTDSNSSFWSANTADAQFDQINQTSHKQEISLPDGSQVWLYPNSRLRYSRDFGQKNRTVYLLGEAGFEVTKNPEKPFYVLANELVTKVLGTRFVVKAFQNDTDVTVTVQQGQVSVYRNRAENRKPTETKALDGVLLLPNQQVIFARQTAHFAKTLVPEPQRIDAESGQTVPFDFDETPVTDVFRKLQQAYGIELVFDENMVKNCQLTSSLENESLFQKLDIITQSIGATYETVDGKVVISAPGCKPQ